METTQTSKVRKSKNTDHFTVIEIDDLQCNLNKQLTLDSGDVKIAPDLENSQVVAVADTVRKKFVLIKSPSEFKIRLLLFFK